jgi:hypothetical protein
VAIALTILMLKVLKPRVVIERYRRVARRSGN